MPLTRRSMLAAGALLPLSSGTVRAQSAEFVIKVGSGNFPDHPSIVIMEQVAKAVAAESHGRIDMQVFASSQLGSDSQMTSQVRSGALECFIATDAVLTAVVPATSLCNMGFAFNSYDAVWKAMDGEFGSYVRQKVADASLHVFEKSWDNGFRQITTGNKPVKDVEDLAGLKIRVPASPLSLSLFKSLGAAPVSINFSELYSALQTGLVQGQDNPIANIETAKLYEVQKYCALTSHTWDGIWIVVNKALWNQLPADLQAILTRNINDGAAQQRALSARLNEDLKATLTSRGMVINQPDVASFKAALQRSGFYAEWKAKFSAEAWTLLERAVGTLA